MRILSVLLLVMAMSAAGEKTRTEITRATTPEDDSKPNSKEVPDVYAVSGQLERVVVLRFKHQTDLLDGLEKMVAKEKIRNAVILAGVGSVRNYHVHSVSNRDFPSKNVFYKDTETPADIVSVNGYVINGKLHAHMTLADGDKAWGGHIEPGNPVFTFAIITLGVFSEGMNLDKADDKTYR
jgi:predicted DNA-binding protein with PD1-like motif